MGGRKRKLLIIEGTATKGGFNGDFVREGGKEEQEREKEMSRGHQAAMGNGKNFPCPQGSSHLRISVRETLSPFTEDAALRVCPLA